MLSLIVVVAVVVVVVIIVVVLLELSVTAVVACLRVVSTIINGVCDNHSGDDLKKGDGADDSDVTMAMMR